MLYQYKKYRPCKSVTKQAMLRGSGRGAVACTYALPDAEDQAPEKRTRERAPPEMSKNQFSSLAAMMGRRGGTRGPQLLLEEAVRSKESRE
jgi:hypothetical protein